MSTPLIQIRNMTLGYGARVLCRNVSFDICEGECIMLCGANGSGKTTLLRQLEAGYRNDRMVMIPARIPKVAGFTLREFIRISCYSLSDMGGKLPKGDEEAIDKALETLSLSHISSRDISTLSDGEFQKASIAAALVRKARIILLDEPTAFLDAENRIAVLRTLRALCDKGEPRPAVIFSTHDLHDGMAVATKVLAIGSDGAMRQETEDLEKAVNSIFAHI